MVVLDVPPRFHEALVSGERTAVQLLVDTTNAPQGLSAAAYTVRICCPVRHRGRLLASAGLSGTKMSMPLVSSAHRLVQSTQDERWFQSISHLLRMITLFAVLLPAAALVREKSEARSSSYWCPHCPRFRSCFRKCSPWPG